MEENQGHVTENNPAEETSTMEQSTQDSTQSFENQETSETSTGHSAAPQETAQKEDSSQSENFRRLREKSERAEKERDEMARMLKEITAAKKEVEADEEDFRINDDDLVEGKHLSKFQKKVKRLEDQVKQYEQQSVAMTTETKLRNQYQDFDKVVSADNVAILREQYPELAESITNNPNLYNKAVSAYTLIKKLGIAPDDHYEADRALAQKNAAKPKPLASVNAQQGDSPLSRANAFANGLTDELQAQLRKEMAEARKYR